MKLRIQGNSLRLRVTRSELDRLQELKPVQETILFGNSIESRLTYALVPSIETVAIQVTFQAGRLLILVPPAEIQHWSQDDQVGLYTALPVGREQRLDLSLEKDFPCMHRAETDPNSFPNTDA